MALSQTEITAANKAILESQRILVIPHANVDADGLSSALACFTLFSALKKDVTVVCPDTKPEFLEFLPGFESLTQEVAGSSQFVITVHMKDGVEVDKLRYTVEDNRVNIIVIPKEGKIHPQDISLGQGDNPFDLIVAVDTADIALFGSVYTDAIDMFSSVPILNIDHHISNTGYGQLQLIDPTAASATEVLYHWFNNIPEWKSLITPDMATLLLTGLITDTRSFQNPNTTPRSLEVAAELLELGARQQEIIKNIYKTKPLSTLKIWGRALNKIQIDPQARIVWSTISKADLLEMEATSKETHGILDELISTIPDADIHVLFTELEDGKGLKASTRSNAKIDVSELVGELFGGGGHPGAAGFRVQKFDNFDLAVLECVSKLKEGLEKKREEVNVVPASNEKLISNEKNEVNKENEINQPKKSESQPLTQPSVAANKESKDKGIDVLGALEKGKEDDGGKDVVEEIDGK